MANRTSLYDRILCAINLNCGIVVHSDSERRAVNEIVKAHGMRGPRIVMRPLPEDG